MFRYIISSQPNNHQLELNNVRWSLQNNSYLEKSIASNKYVNVDSCSHLEIKIHKKYLLRLLSFYHIITTTIWKYFPTVWSVLFYRKKASQFNNISVPGITVFLISSVKIYTLHPVCSQTNTIAKARQN